MNLLEAVHRVNVPRAAALLFRGANVNVTDDQGVTPLIIACERGEQSYIQHKGAGCAVFKDGSERGGADAAAYMLPCVSSDHTAERSTYTSWSLKRAFW